jgi:hypothetical protein
MVISADKFTPNGSEVGSSFLQYVIDEVMCIRLLLMSQKIFIKLL